MPSITHLLPKIGINIGGEINLRLMETRLLARQLTEGVQGFPHIAAIFPISLGEQNQVIHEKQMRERRVISRSFHRIPQISLI